MSYFDDNGEVSGVLFAILASHTFLSVLDEVMDVN